MKVFWSWQFDTPGKIGRRFVRDALGAAIERLKETPEIEEPTEREARSAMHLDHDRKGIQGSPDLARVILQKIEQSAVFVADVTPVAITTTQKDEGQRKKIINPNVAIELGYALHALGDRALLMVMNEHYGGRADLPFDLQSKGGPIMFNLAPDADRKTITAASRQLTSHLAEALELCIGQYVESVRRARPFPQAELKDGPARFRSPGEALGIRHLLGTSISLAPGPAMWLRLMPRFDPGKPSTIANLGKALNQGINLPTLIGPAKWHLYVPGGRWCRHVRPFPRRSANEYCRICLQDRRGVGDRHVGAWSRANDAFVRRNRENADRTTAALCILP